MKEEFYFIEETSRAEKIKTFVVTVFVLALIACAVLFFLSVSKNFAINIQDTKYLTPIGLFVIGIVGGLFFVPLPQEPFFYYGLLNGNSVALSFVGIMSGFLLAQFFNYYCGVKLSRPISNLISKRKLYKSRRFINKYGGVGVFFFNLFPLPSPQLTFALGISKYNIYRIIFYATLGIFLKYIAVTLIFSAFH